MNLPEGAPGYSQPPYDGPELKSELHTEHGVESMPTLTATEKLSAVLLGTQYEGLKVLTAEKVAALADLEKRQALLSGEMDDDQDADKEQDQ